jgi:hypothetical protein
MTILISIVGVIFALFSILFLWYVAYPFLLRYTIDSRLQNNNLINASNGNNGQNGNNGENSPDARNGVNGQPGTGTAAGKHGANGAPGKSGDAGFTGDDGEPGDNGIDGDEGVPGFNIIPVREKLFDPDARTVYYVNGVQLEDHVNNTNERKLANINQEKLRISNRLDVSTISTSDRQLFKNALALIPVMTPNVSIYVLDTIDKFNNFLDTFTLAYIAAKTNEDIIKSTSKLAIGIDNAILEDLRKKRILDYKKLETTPFKLGVRLTIHNDVRTSNPGLSARFLTILTDLEGDINLTYDSKIRDLTLLLTQQNRIFTSISPSVTPADKNAAALEIKVLTSEINLLKMIKEEIIIRKNDDRSLILERYDNGDLSGTNPHGLLLETYGTGANPIKQDIEDSKQLVIDAAEVRKQAMESFIVPYRNSN